MTALPEQTKRAPQTAPRSILPGSTLGMLGGGQLGRMFAMAAKRMGYKVHIFTPEADSPAGQVSDYTFTAAYRDEAALQAFADSVDVIGLEFENIPASTIHFLSKRKPVYPDASVLETTQHRIREKTFLAKHHFPVTPFYPIHTVADFQPAIESIGYPAVLKTAGFGYDGKGQTHIPNAEALARVIAMAEEQALYQDFPFILEKWIDYTAEFSIIAARNPNRQCVVYPVFENTHRRHILHETRIPAVTIPEPVAREAAALARTVVEALNVTGVFCIECFLTPDTSDTGGILINETAPRPHNSGHITLDAFQVSQFEQQVRAICNLPLLQPEPLVPAAAMINLLGDAWEKGVPDWPALLNTPGLSLHLYGKSAVRRGRKMGHLNLLAKDQADLQANIQRVESILEGNP